MSYIFAYAFRRWTAYLVSQSMKGNYIQGHDILIFLFDDKISWAKCIN